MLHHLLIAHRYLMLPWIKLIFIGFIAFPGMFQYISSSSSSRQFNWCHIYIWYPHGEADAWILWKHRLHDINNDSIHCFLL